MRDDFAVLILSHGRADQVVTIKTLQRCGYTGKWYIVLDTEDEQEQKYRDNFGDDHIILFDKSYAATKFDIMDNFPGRGVPTFARNMFWEIAKNLGLTYFLELEDDYNAFNFRIEMAGHLPLVKISDFDAVCDAYIDYLDKSGCLTVAFCQAGDIIGGAGSVIGRNKYLRKAMNCFFCRTDTEFRFLGRFNDDVNAYITYGKTGGLFLTFLDVCMVQPLTQQNTGGITAAYKGYGTYVKSFYSVMLRPDCVKIAMMGEKDRRIHHKILQPIAYPAIISDRYRKER